MAVDMQFQKTRIEIGVGARSGTLPQVLCRARQLPGELKLALSVDSSRDSKWRCDWPSVISQTLEGVVASVSLGPMSVSLGGEFGRGSRTSFGGCLHQRDKQGHEVRSWVQ